MDGTALKGIKANFIKGTPPAAQPSPAIVAPLAGCVSRNNVYRVNNGAIAGTIVNGESVNAAVGASTSIDTSHYTTPVNTLRFNPVYPNENKIMTVGEIKMTVKVNESDYMAWKEEYGLTNNAYIP